MKKEGLLTRKSRQKIKKMVCLRVSRGKNQKNGASENSARPNQLKMGCREIPQAQINLKWRVGKFRKPKST